MPDPRYRPALELARPGDVTAARRRPMLPARELWEVEFGGTRPDRWHWAYVTSRWDHPDGREIIQLEFNGGDGLRTDTYFTDPAKMTKWTDPDEVGELPGKSLPQPIFWCPGI